MAGSDPNKLIAKADKLSVSLSSLYHTVHTYPVIISIYFNFFSCGLVYAFDAIFKTKNCL